MVQRLQTWVDAIDTAARQTTWGKKSMLYTPKPHILLLSDETPNAFVAPVFVAYPADVTIPGGKTGSQEVDAVTANASGPEEYSADVPLELEQLIKGRPELLSDVIKRQRFVHRKTIVLRPEPTASKEFCLPRYLGEGRVMFPMCNENQKKQTVQSKLSVSRQTAPYITVHTGLLRLVDENGAISMVAHELGHYYRAHATDESAPSSGFFFYEKDAASAKRPAEITDEELRISLHEKMVSAAGRPRDSISGTVYDSNILMTSLRKTIDPSDASFSDLKTDDFKGKLNSEGRIPVRYLYLRKCYTVHADKSHCREFERVVEQSDVKKLLDSPGFPEAETYRKLEASLLPFAPDLSFYMGEEPVSVTSADLPMGHLRVKFLLQCPTSLFETSNNLSSTRVNFEKLYQACTKEVVANRAVADKAIEELRRLGVGWYTTEQEADELSVEMMASVGLSPEKGLAGLMHAFKHFHENGVDYGGMDYPSCMKLADNMFGFNSDRVTPVPLGDWSDNHHDFCYRIFNIVRDSISHKYQVKQKTRPTFTETWESVVRTLPPPVLRGTDGELIENRFFAR